MNGWEAGNAWGRENHHRLALALDNLVDSLIEAENEHGSIIWDDVYGANVKRWRDNAIELLNEQGRAMGVVGRPEEETACS